MRRGCVRRTGSRACAIAILERAHERRAERRLRASSTSLRAVYVSRLPASRSVVDPADPDPAALDAGGAGLEERRAGRVRDRDRLRPGSDRHPALSGRADLRGQRAGRRSTRSSCTLRVSQRHARALADWPERAERLASRFWPGPLTLGARSKRRSSPTWSRPGGTPSALRAPAGRGRGLIERVGQPVAAPSANRSNRISPTRAEHVLADLDGEIDLVIDSGPTTVGLESTVLDLTGRHPADASARARSRGRAGSGARWRVCARARSGEHTARRPASPGRCRSITRRARRRIMSGSL